MISDNTSKYGLKKIFGYLLPFILTIILLYFAFKDQDFTALTDALSNVSILGTIAFIVFFLFSHFLRALRWKFILNSVKPDTSITNLFAATMVGYGMNALVPRLGELYRSLFLGRWEDISRTSVLGTIIVERVIDIVALGLSVLISVMIYSGDLYSDLNWLKSTIYIIFLMMAGVILLIYLTVRFKEKFYEIILKLVGKISTRLASKLGYIFSTLVDGFSSLKGTKNYLATFFFTALIMFIYGFNAYVGFYMLRMDEIQEVTLGMGWILMTIGAFGIIIPTPGGTGSYHLITIAVLAGLFSFSEEVAGAYAVLTHFISYTLFILLLFGSVAFINRRRAKQGFQHESFISVFKLKPDEK